MFEAPPTTTTAGTWLATFFAASATWGCTSAFDDLKAKGESCVHAIPPERPDTGTDDVTPIEFVNAVDEYDMGEIGSDDNTQRFRAMGYDLDGVCTGQGQGPSCHNPIEPIDPVIDGDVLEGRDNTQGAVVYHLFNIIGIRHSTSQEVNDEIWGGIVTSLIRVQDYNGQPNDSKVIVDVFAATMQRPDGTRTVPSRQGNDEWAPIEGWVVKDLRGEYSADHPKYLDKRAYVTNGMLVAHLEVFQSPTVTLSDMWITARIVHTNSVWVLTEGTMAGRVRTDDLLDGLDKFQDPGTHQFFCKDADNYPRAKVDVCSASDISFDPSNNPSALCDATSWGWHFTAVPAKISSPVAFQRPDPNPTRCKPGMFSGEDSCAKP
jgi:hypothetical protein